MKRFLAWLLAGVLVLIGGCTSSGSKKSSTPPAASSKVTGSINVLAAASLTETFTTLKKQVEAKYPGTTINLTFGASSDLSTQINQGKPADVFASASNKNMIAVVSAGNASKPVDFVSNTLEIAVPPSNPGRITQLADLAKPGVKVGVCAPAVPCGVVAAKVFANAKLNVKASANLQDVKSTLAVVESGEVDAGLVYVTDVRSAAGKVKGIEIPTEVNASTTYPIVALKDAKNGALAKAFVDYVLSPEGQQVLTAGGFKKP